MLNNNERRSNVGRTPSLYGFRPNRIDVQNLRTVTRAVAAVDPHFSRSDLFRDGLALLAHQAVQGGEWVDLVKERNERAELERRLDLAERKARQLERKASVADQRAKKKGADLQALLRFLPDVRRRVALNLDVASGTHALDEIWYACRKSWARVAERLQQVQDALDDDPDPGGG